MMWSLSFQEIYSENCDNTKQLELIKSMCKFHLVVKTLIILSLIVKQH